MNEINSVHGHRFDSESRNRSYCRVISHFYESSKRNGSNKFKRRKLNQPSYRSLSITRPSCIQFETASTSTPISQNNQRINSNSENVLSSQILFERNFINNRNDGMSLRAPMGNLSGNQFNRNLSSSDQSLNRRSPT